MARSPSSNSRRSSDDKIWTVAELVAYAAEAQRRRAQARARSQQRSESQEGQRQTMALVSRHEQWLASMESIETQTSIRFAQLDTLMRATEMEGDSVQRPARPLESLQRPLHEDIRSRPASRQPMSAEDSRRPASRDSYGRPASPRSGPRQATREAHTSTDRHPSRSMSPRRDHQGPQNRRDPRFSPGPPNRR